ncbi:ATP-binding protein [Streptomyces cupreus]|uniref:LuxR family transcriptional regulator n=1 Tax=Streptomyces cupreus TaxID=2759956 RepID=A0A7X1J9U5_9ACTN|nr:LuxR C-terminal-related transcriptional regulator [Streptomyces cupreus]MBC2904287.1 LuxR family transcriptional regulator [Streptomyces cupreus]
MGLGFGQRRGGQLPAERTSFVGRAEELALVQRVFQHAPLVTLVGPGGVGKSRTALRAAAALHERFPDGVWPAELSALRDPELLPATLGAVLELPEQPGMEPLDALVAHLRSRRLLIILDTCEHLVDACATVCDTLLREAADVCVLATSRQPLDVPGEHCLPIAPLPVEDALELFVQRAAAAVPDFAVTDANRDRIETLVARMEGIPLALELAAVRLRTLPLEQMVARLDQRFGALTGTRRTAPVRHQTLRAAIDWSYELCTPAQQLLWARLTVFAGSFELPTAERVCTGGPLQAQDVLETLAGLVDKSVLERADDSGRYRLLDTMRTYGGQRLTAADTDAVRARHFTHYRHLGARLWDELMTENQAELHKAVRAEIADIRAALHYAYATEDRAPEGLWLAAQLAPYWRAAGALSEGRFWIERGLELVAEDCAPRAWGLFMTGVFAVWSGDLTKAPEQFTRAREAARQCGETRVEMFTQPYLGAMRALCGEIDEGLAELEEGRRRIVAAGDALGMGVVHYEGALLRAVLGDIDGALEYCDTGLGHLEGTGERQIYASTLAAQGIILWLAGRPEESAQPLHHALEAVSEVGDVLVAALCCLGLAWHAARKERFCQAAWLLGYAASARRLTGDPIALLPSMMEQQQTVHRAARTALGRPAFDRWHTVGARMTGTEILHAVRADADAPPSAHTASADRGNDSATHTLTARETEVAALVVQGLSNREVAERLVISKRTADTHVERILAKLNITSRTAIADALAAQQ